MLRAARHRLQISADSDEVLDDPFNEGAFMFKSEILAAITSRSLVAMLRMPSADDALEMAEVLVDAGITCLQVPLTVPGALEVIAELQESYGDQVLVGAGTVLDGKSADACIQAGAQFIVGPTVDLGIISRCHEAGVTVVSGALTPTEVVTAWNAGADIVRLYPCSVMGGPNYVRLLRAPLPHIRLMPAGGVSLQLAADYIAAGATAVEGDCDLVDLDALRGNRTQDIATNVHLYLDVLEQARSLAMNAE